MPHVHLSLQSGDDMILKRMKRRHSRALAIELVARMQAARPTSLSVPTSSPVSRPRATRCSPTASIWSTQCNIVHGHIFPYSPKTGTPAALMPQVPASDNQGARQGVARCGVAQARRWLASLDRQRTKYCRRNGRSAGHAENFAYVKLDRPMAEGSDRCGPSKRVQGRTIARERYRMTEKAGWTRQIVRRVQENIRQTRRKSHRPCHQRRSSMTKRSTISRTR